MNKGLVEMINLILGNYDMERLVDGIAGDEYYNEAEMIAEFMMHQKSITQESLAEKIQCIMNERFGTVHSLEDCMYVSDDILWNL